MKKLLCILLALCLAGACAASTEGESAQLRTGRKLMKEYLAERGGRASLTESHADVLRPDADRLVLSDFVKGTFRDGSGEYEFAVNVVTGEIYTSESLPLFQEACVRLIEARLGLEPSNCVGTCTVWTCAPAWETPRSEWPDETAYLGHVLPVGVTDLETAAARAIGDGLIRLSVDIACLEALSAERWSGSDTVDWNETTVTLYGLGGPEARLPSPEEFTYDYQSAFKGDRLRLSREELRFTPGAASAGREGPAAPIGPVHKTPEEQIDLFLERENAWYQGGTPDYYPAYLYYAVTDLNQNGRLEIICSEFRYDTNVSINRFFELDEAETGVVELDYDLSADDDTCIAPGLVNAALPTLCFFGDGAYHYSVPTPGEPNENLEIEYFYMLSVDRQGRVSTELLAQKWVSHTTDTTSYLRGLDRIEQREYDAADLIRYDGCDVCEVSWDWVMLLEGWDRQEFRAQLTDSWERFAFDILGLSGGSDQNEGAGE